MLIVGTIVILPWVVLFPISRHCLTPASMTSHQTKIRSGV